MRTLLPKFDTKISTLEERDNLSTMTLHQLHVILTTYEMRIESNTSTSKETAVKVEKKDDSDSDLLDDFEAMIVRKLKKMYRDKLSFKCFDYGKAWHFSVKCPYIDQNDEEEKFEKFSRRKLYNPNKKTNNFKKKSLFSKEDSWEESREGGENLFMVEIENIDKTTIIGFFFGFDCVNNFCHQHFGSHYVIHHQDIANEKEEKGSCSVIQNMFTQSNLENKPIILMDSWNTNFVSMSYNKSSNHSENKFYYIP